MEYEALVELPAGREVNFESLNYFIFGCISVNDLNKGSIYYPSPTHLSVNYKILDDS